MPNENGGKGKGGSSGGKTESGGSSNQVVDTQKKSPIIGGGGNTQRLANGDTYRATNTGYVWTHGGRTLYINSKSVNAGEKARELITSGKFDQIFKKSQAIKSLGRNTRAIYLK